MKTHLLLATMLITTSAFSAPKNISPAKGEERNSQPNNEIVLNIDHLRQQTKDVSLLKPVFIIVSAVQNLAEKLHGKKLKIICNKSADQRD